MRSRLRDFGGDFGEAVPLCAAVAMTAFVVGCATPRTAAEHDRRTVAAVLGSMAMGTAVCAPLGPFALACGVGAVVQVAANRPSRPPDVGTSGPETLLRLADFSEGGSVAVLEDSIVRSRNGGGAVMYADATLVNNLNSESPTDRGEHSYLIDIAVDCEMGKTAALRVSAHSGFNGTGMKLWKSSSTMFYYLKSPQSIEGITRGMCERTH